MTLSKILFWPFPGIWNYFIVLFNDDRYWRLVCGGMSVNLDRTGLMYICSCLCFFYILTDWAPDFVFCVTSSNV
jgi:hypothetical protein